MPTYIDSQGQKYWFGTSREIARVAAGVFAVGIGTYVLGATLSDMVDNYSAGISGREAQRALVEILLAGYALYEGKKGIAIGRHHINHIHRLENYLGRPLYSEDFYRVHPT